MEKTALKSITINRDMSIRETIKKLDQGAKKILLVVDKSENYIGTITDGDIRRWILKNKSLDHSAIDVTNKESIYLLEGQEGLARKKMIEHHIAAIPIIDRESKIKDIKFLYEYEGIKFEKNALNNVPVVIMAGGLGTRLYPYTKILPKPLIPIGDTPIVQRIMDKFKEYGNVNFYMSVNYKKGMIKSYFNELCNEYSIQYIDEDKPLGTGGSLSLLKGKIKDTFFVSNCDILVETDYEEIYKFHKESGNKITVVSSIKNFVIPYGVFRLNNDGNINKIQEKPEYSYLINTGMYVLEPEVLEDIPEGVFYNLPDILDEYINKDIKIGVFPISEKSWMDMGQINEMKEMVDLIEEKEQLIGRSV